jgi:molybdate transport system substrate-binding protein
MRRRTVELAIACALLGAPDRLVLGADSSAEAPVATTGARKLTVFAAASLREAFQDLAARFEADHRGTHVRLSFAGSQELRAQIDLGARADVFASADAKQMSALADKGAVLAPRLFAGNEPVVVLPAANPAQVRAFADLPRATHIVIGVPEVPIGAYTLQILDRANATMGDDFGRRVQAHVVSRELNVRQVLAKVILGEADAAIVYRTDARAAGTKVATVPIPSSINVTAEYLIGVLKNAPEADLARAWVSFVLGPAGEARLGQAGFSAAGGGLAAK